MASPLDREAIMAALYALVLPAFAWGTTGRKLLAWTSVTTFPAMFVQHIGDEYLTASGLNQHRPTGLPPMIYIDAEIWLYADAGSALTAIAEPQINQLIDAIEGALQAPPAPSAQTLDGLVRHCWIDGKITIDPGNLDGKGKAIIPVRMLVPGVSPTGVARP